ncbi:hypothetical protein [Evansella tamaricis]|uniref:Uncharacterized protein n=1 Tax=Evansella tamaricis TaxID=2069301 RepID=A0ABS6J9U8_9BACI|nr:hypothetical protein [Evansella tamaricis]MBU9710459.1 hypothetical protein [Evansella tamaricis]
MTTMIGAIIPLLLTLFIIYAFVEMRRKNNSKGTFWRGTRLKVLLGTYATTLLISMLFFPFLPYTSYGEISENEQLHNESQRFFDALYDGRLEERREEVIVRERYQFDYQDDILYLETTNYTEFYDTVFVEQSESQETIEVIYYVELGKYRQLINTEDIPTLRADLFGNRLHLEQPDLLTINFFEYKKEFPLAQFSGEDWWDDRGYRYLGQSAIYIKVPEELQVISRMADGHLQFVR